MKKRFWLVIAACACCLVWSGLILINSQVAPTNAAAAKSQTNFVTVAPTQECAQCESHCKAWVDKCKEGGQYACYKAAACLCKCNLDAGGCGSSKDALRECYEQNEKAAKALESPGQ
jgi:hypothetical protein